jgi:hypothetical protein
MVPARSALTSSLVQPGGGSSRSMLARESSPGAPASPCSVQPDTACSECRICKPKQLLCKQHLIALATHQRAMRLHDCGGCSKCRLLIGSRKACARAVCFECSSKLLSCTPPGPSGPERLSPTWSCVKKQPPSCGGLPYKQLQSAALFPIPAVPPQITAAKQLRVMPLHQHSLHLAWPYLLIGKDGLMQLACNSQPPCCSARIVTELFWTLHTTFGRHILSGA